MADELYRNIFMPKQYHFITGTIKSSIDFCLKGNIFEGFFLNWKGDELTSIVPIFTKIKPFKVDFNPTLMNWINNEKCLLGIS
jgi:hypothetical protein